MKILQIIQKPQMRGAETFACQLSQHLVKSGHDVIIVTLFDGTNQLPFDGRVVNLKRNQSRRFFDIGGYYQLSKLIKEFQPDIVQANASDSLKYSVFSKIVFGWKNKIVFRNASMISNYIKSKPSKLFNSLLMRNVHFTISVSQTTRTDYCKVFPFMRERTFVVPIGINEDNNGLLDSTTNKDVYIHIGGFSFEKNHKGLINIFQKVLLTKPQAKLWLVGDGPLQAEIRTDVKQKGLENSIVFLNARTDVHQLLRQANALLLSSIIEGLPAVILEAFYNKIPVVAYNIGAVHELVENEKTGFLIPINNEEQFATSVLSLDTRDDLKEITERAYIKVCSSYSNKIIAQELLKLYNKVS